ncbi:MAG: sigma-70 family RNA polymerase sigma factor [Phycisphaerae bacterium]|jgi:RNA polymerase sigma-70 factor (ECF subfamily)|nr:sigma-70 family RNA polymerase sigma factor [Phycisphaerae bacterium]
MSSSVIPSTDQSPLSGSGQPPLPPEAIDELRRVAGFLLRKERPGHTLQPTALVHEAYLRLGARLGNAWRAALGEAAFRVYAAHAMRQILIDHARKHSTGKRGRGWLRVEMVDTAVDAPDALELLALNDALDELAALDERKARVVELRFFGGLTLDETAKALNIARSTADADWSMARAWLARRLASTSTASTDGGTS